MAKAKITITGSGKSDAYTPYAFLLINDEVYTSAQTVEVDLGTICQCRIGRGTKGVVAVLLDEQAVVEVTTSYGEASYDLTVDRNYTISLEVATGAIIRITSGEEVNPMAPHDGHNTNIGNVARQIEAGMVRLGGVGREIGSGLTLVNGVAREIPFAAPVQVVISGAPYSGRAYATINGTAVYNAGTYEYDEMPTISVYVASANTSMSQSCKVTLDGQTVLSGKGTYNLNVDANKITIEFTNKGNISMWVYTCDITTE